MTRLQELVKQATHDVLGVKQLDSIILAELIVRECIKVCDGNHEYKNHTDTLFGKGIAEGIQICKIQIADRFGVE